MRVTPTPLPPTTVSSAADLAAMRCSRRDDTPMDPRQLRRDIRVLYLSFRILLDSCGNSCGILHSAPLQYMAKYTITIASCI